MTERKFNLEMKLQIIFLATSRDEDYVKDPGSLLVDLRMVIVDYPEQFTRRPMFYRCCKGRVSPPCVRPLRISVRFADKGAPSTIFRTRGRNTRRSLCSRSCQRVYQKMFSGISFILLRGLEKAEWYERVMLLSMIWFFTSIAGNFRNKKISGLFTAGQTNGTSGGGRWSGLLQGIMRL